jgi:dTDP-4-amino-4,6-dideoxygalactose transaminase
MSRGGCCPISTAASPPPDILPPGVELRSIRRIPPVYFRVAGAAMRDAARRLERRGQDDIRRVATARVAALFPTRSVVLMDSGTSALTIALARSASPAGSVRRVALPAYACPDVATAAIGAGLPIVLYDVNPQTLSPDEASLDEVLARGVSHVVVTHLFGRLVDVAAIRRKAEAAGAVVIEDAAQWGGGTLGGVRGAAVADWSILSFGRGKGINAGGGGALLTVVPLTETECNLADVGLQDSVSQLARALATECFSYPAWYGLPAQIPALGLGGTVYHAPRAARRITGVSAALLTHALDTLEAARSRRASAEHGYLEALCACPAVECPPLRPGTRSGALRMPVLLEPTLARSLEELGVVRSYPRTLQDYPEIAAVLAFGRQLMPGADRLAAQLHTLPTHDRVSPANRTAIIAALCDAGTHGATRPDDRRTL